MMRILGRGLMSVLVAALFLWAADWLIWQGRVLGGGGYKIISVNRFVVAPLKGNKEEYYADGTEEILCTRSLLPEGFPQAAAKPCWWVEGHPIHFDRSANHKEQFGDSSTRLKRARHVVAKISPGEENLQ